jgi:hypothetical protein
MRRNHIQKINYIVIDSSIGTCIFRKISIDFVTFSPIPDEGVSNFWVKETETILILEISIGLRIWKR